MRERIAFVFADSRERERERGGNEVKNGEEYEWS